MGIDEKRVRAKFIQLLRQRTPDHPWVLKHDREVREATERAESIEEVIERADVIDPVIERTEKANSDDQCA